MPLDLAQIATRDSDYDRRYSGDAAKDWPRKQDGQWPHRCAATN